MLRLSCAPFRSRANTKRFAARPAIAVSTTGRPGTSGGSAKRWTASRSTQPATPNSSTALASAARTSAR
jgi:hypothetical protein